MKRLLEWLTEYGAEYDASSQVLKIRKPMQVGDFVELKKVLLPYRHRVKDIRVGL